ncbi:hypothetical protein NHQ30_005265 [Ciborinia camelliae]|nr:hypothetical protein NHQ30_005265 [Ciborinia camelliae]
MAHNLRPILGLPNPDHQDLPSLRSLGVLDYHLRRPILPPLDFEDFHVYPMLNPAGPVAGPMVHQRRHPILPPLDFEDFHVYPMLNPAGPVAGPMVHQRRHPILPPLDFEDFHVYPMLNPAGPVASPIIHQRRHPILPPLDFEDFHVYPMLNPAGPVAGPMVHQRRHPILPPLGLKDFHVHPKHVMLNPAGLVADPMVHQSKFVLTLACYTLLVMLACYACLLCLPVMLACYACLLCLPVMLAYLGGYIVAPPAQLVPLAAPAPEQPVPAWVGQPKPPAAGSQLLTVWPADSIKDPHVHLVQGKFPLRDGDDANVVGSMAWVRAAKKETRPRSMVVALVRILRDSGPIDIRAIVMGLSKLCDQYATEFQGHADGGSDNTETWIKIDKTVRQTLSKKDYKSLFFNTPNSLWRLKRADDA